LVNLDCSTNKITYLDVTMNKDLKFFEYDEDEVEVIGWPR
jgi:hypothetical protein